jgi:PAS domain S-box-containing protein
MWIDDTASENHLRTWLKHCPAMKLVSTLDGQILWANAAFCDWSQYTLNELRKLTWMEISVRDKNLEADIAEAKNLDAYNPTYQIKKQYIPKGSKPEWGQLTVMRYPLSGEIECCLCTWEPLKNGTATAFAMAMEHTQKLDARIEAMTAELKMITTQTEEDRFFLSTIRMVQRYPKASAAMLFFALSIFGLNNIVELLQRTGLIQLPVKIERVGNEEQSHAVLAHEIADPVRVVAVEEEFSTTIGNATVNLVKYSDGRFGPVSVVRGCRSGVERSSGQFAGSTTGSDRTAFSANRGSDGMQNAESVRDF